ncbi:Rab effector MyRIP [Dissostichus eleginoides]|uniref:Rab effector MyRIP n=1 Tax=Dissostichus eleginoides TaxID=100907 RepID=A0AAD9B7V2_DISEL|nr:Rab effector MyRIP [Dissostichus eleginoides]
MRKNKRLLSVHPLDFDPEDYFPYSRRPSVQQQLQEERGFRNDDYFDTNNMRGNRRKSLYNMRAEEESRMVRTRSLSRISSSAARQYVDTNSRASSQENLGQAPPPMSELNKRMSAIESLLNRGPGEEQKLLCGGPGEEEKLRRKLSELGGPLSDKGGPSSDEEPLRKPAGRPPAGRPPAVRGGRDKEMSSSSDETSTQAQKRSSAAALCDLTADVLRTINATENAAQEYDLQPQSPPAGRPPAGRPDAKQADEAFRELEENVRKIPNKYLKH